MKTIKLVSLKLRNFKGAHDLTVNFSHKTLIQGDNGTGKTTIFDAFCWLLYGKNSANESDFGIKTNDKEGNAIPKQEHEVEGLIDVNGTNVKLRRLYSEKWTKKRGNCRARSVNRRRSKRNPKGTNRSIECNRTERKRQNTPHGFNWCAHRHERASTPFRNVRTSICRPLGKCYAPV